MDFTSSGIVTYAVITETIVTVNYEVRLLNIMLQLLEIKV